jgi:hypothetical protein
MQPGNVKEKIYKNSNLEKVSYNQERPIKKTYPKMKMSQKNQPCNKKEHDSKESSKFLEIIIKWGLES